MSCPVKERPYATAEKLLDAIRPMGTLIREISSDFRYTWSNRILWRGVSDAKYLLTPAALRSGTPLVQHPGAWVSAPLKWEDQVMAEAHTLWFWLSLCDENALPLPEDGATARLEIAKYVEFRKHVKIDVKNECLRNTLDPWPPPRLWSMLAVAQHFDLPTRLLDFTYDPFVAAYFAARRVLEKQTGDDPSHLAIWCLPDRLITDQGQRGDCPPVPDQRLQLVSAPNYGNRRQAAQQGLFLLDSKPGETNPANLLDSLPSSSHPAIKLVLPWTQARDLLGQLGSLGYSHNRLFPDYEGATRAMELHRLSVGPQSQGSRK